MELELNATKPPLLTLASSGGNFTIFGDIPVWVLQPENSSNKQLAFVLGTVRNPYKYFMFNTNNIVIIDRPSMLLLLSF